MRGEIGFDAGLQDAPVASGHRSHAGRAVRRQATKDVLCRCEPVQSGFMHAWFLSPTCLLPTRIATPDRRRKGHRAKHMDDRIEKLIGRLAPEMVCDGCLAERLELALDDVRQQIHALAGTRGHERTTASCALCDAENTGTRRSGR